VGQHSRLRGNARLYYADAECHLQNARRELILVVRRLVGAIRITLGIWQIRADWLHVSTVCEVMESRHSADVLVSFGTTSTFTAGYRRRHQRSKPNLFAITDNGSAAAWAAAGPAAVCTIATASPAARHPPG
jgi:hypothetical protein